RGPSSSSNVGSGRPDIAAWAHTIGEAIAAISSVPHCSQPPMPSLSYNHLSAATPSSIPDVVADVPTAIHAASRGCHGRQRSVSPTARKKKRLSAMPHPICSFQYGKFLIVSPGGYFTALL